MAPATSSRFAGKPHMTAPSAKLLQTGPLESISTGVAITRLGPLPDGAEIPVSILEFTIDPYVCSELGANPITEVFRVLSGRGTVLILGKEFQVEPGDWVVIEPNAPHQVRNESAEVLRAVSLSWARRAA